MNRRLRWGGCVTWRQVAQTVVSETPTCAAIWLTDMPVRARSRICCFFVASIGRQAVLRIPRAVVVSLTPAVGATLGVLDSGATSSAMRRLRKASRGSQLFELMLPRCTNKWTAGCFSDSACFVFQAAFVKFRSSRSTSFGVRYPRAE